MFLLRSILTVGPARSCKRGACICWPTPSLRAHRAKKAWRPYPSNLMKDFGRKIPKLIAGPYGLSKKDEGQL